ncbi:MAG: chemotaxis protein CheA [Rhizobiales bacterium]|nr:chemotaxis protein CheA [Hyphomicrobiales bacterium]
MDDIELFKKTFFQECADLLGSLEAQLGSLQSGDRDPELVHESFRAIHSIKGGAGAFGFRRLIAYVHVMETVFDLIRSDKLELSDELLNSAVRASDVLADLVHAAEVGQDLEANFESAAANDLAQAAGLDRDQSLFDTLASQSSTATMSAPPGAKRRCTIEFQPKYDMLRRANEPILIVRQLKELGDVKTMVDTSALPALDAIDATDAYLAWTFELETDAGIDVVREAFEFVEDDCHLSITFEDIADAAEPVLAASAGGETPAPRAISTASIRVELERVDRLVNLVGEIAIGQAMVSQQIDDELVKTHPRLVQELTALLAHTHNLQESVMAIRAQPVKSIFARMPRIVRELSDQTGKAVRIEMAGENTEIDKTVIEQLLDPLTHMIRNAVDHGIEAPQDRLAAGKPEEGLIRLRAEQRGSRIVVEITDDGRGIDRERVRRKAIDKKLIAADAHLSDEEIDNLIFLPGFSTADSISDISGRGVGMDVVNKNIRKLGGRVSIRSVPGRGSSVMLTLPLTLAVLDGMVVRSGDETFVIPLTNIIESLLLRDDLVNDVAGSGKVLKFRNEYLALIDLKQTFNIPAQQDMPNELAIVVEVEDGSLVGLVVDEIQGQQQVVIKSLEENFDVIPGIAGATILGDGEVALILDATAVRELNGRRPANSANTGKATMENQEIHP